MEINKNIGIGGSDIAAIMGNNKHRSPYDVWLQKTGREEKKPLGEKQKFGLKLEPIILAELAERIPEITFTANKETARGRYEFLLCVPDALYIGGIVSIKNTTRTIAYDKELPEYWLAQINWEMGICGRENGYIAWLERGSEFKVRSVAFDADYFETQKKCAIFFWEEYVLLDVPPPATTVEDAAQMWPSHVSGKSIYADSKIESYHKSLGYIKQQLKPLEDEKELITNAIKVLMSDNESIVNEQGKPLFTFKQSKSRMVIDEVAFKETYPELYETLLIEKAGNRVLLTKFGEEK